MGEYDSHSFIPACDFRVDDVDRMWKWLEKYPDPLTSIGAHHVVFYTSIWESDRVLVTIGIRQAGSIREVLRSPALFEWFGISAVDDIPPVFGGEVVEKILYGPSPDHDVVVGAMASVGDIPTLMEQVYDGIARFKRGGVRKIWVYQALDDGREVLILQESVDERSARQWIERQDAAEEWMAAGGFGAYPTQFVGRFEHLVSIGERV